MPTVAAALALILGACSEPDRGQCLESHRRGAWVQFIPIRSGNVTIVNQIHHPAKVVCDRWEYPEGRPAPVARDEALQTSKEGSHG